MQHYLANVIDLADRLVESWQLMSVSVRHSRIDIVDVPILH